MAKGRFDPAPGRKAKCEYKQTNGQPINKPASDRHRKRVYSHVDRAFEPDTQTRMDGQIDIDPALLARIFHIRLDRGLRNKSDYRVIKLRTNFKTAWQAPSEGLEPRPRCK